MDFLEDSKNECGNGEPDPFVFVQDYEAVTKEAVENLQKSVAEVYTNAFKTRQEMVNNEKEFHADYHAIEKEGESFRNQIIAKGKERQLKIEYQKESLMREKESESYLNDLCHESQMKKIRSEFLEKVQEEKTEAELRLKAIEEISRKHELENRFELEKMEKFKEERLRQIENECLDELEKMKRKFEILKDFEESRLRKAIAAEEEEREEIRKAEKRIRAEFLSRREGIVSGIKSLGKMLKKKVNVGQKKVRHAFSKVSNSNDEVAAIQNEVMDEDQEEWIEIRKESTEPYLIKKEDEGGSTSQRSDDGKAMPIEMGSEAAN